ncbi:unnamed protein product [Camellia sinensis]
MSFGMELAFAALILACLHSFVSPDAQGDALYALRKSLNASVDQLKDWNPNQVSPCTWSKVMTLQTLEYILWCEAEMKRLREEAIRYKTELDDLRLIIQLEKDEKELKRKGKYKEEEMEALQKEAEEAEAAASKEQPPEEQHIHAFTLAQGEVKERKKNMLYNITVEIEIPGSKRTTLNAILDTGATTCVVDSDSVPADALEENSYTVEFNGINSQSKANKKLKGGKMYIGDNWFRIPYTYSFPFQLGGRIQMIIGCNFIRSMYGGVRIEGDNVTFYKNVITIQTRQSVNLLEAEPEENEDFIVDHYYDHSAEWIFHSTQGSIFEDRYPKVIKQLHTCGIIEVTDRPQQTSAAPGAPLIEDQIREYRRDQRAKFVRERKAKKVIQKFRRKQPTTVQTRNLPGGNVSFRFGNYTNAQQSAPVQYDANDNEIMVDSDEENSVRDELSHRQETLLFLELDAPDHPDNQKCSLQGNSITGSIPIEFGNLTSLTMLDLENNRLTGEIPSSLGNLKKLQFLYLNQNNLTGSSHSPKIGTIVGIVIGLLGLLLLGSMLLLWWMSRHKRFKREVFVDVAGEVDRRIAFGQLRRFAWRELQLATDNFNEKNVLGKGGFGKVYKGVLSDNTKVAVKRLNDYESPGGDAAFQREVEMISVAVHRNLLRLIGFCSTPTERLLVYPFMQNLSVASRLRELKPGEPVLDWPTRKRVALGTARGLEYLHEHCNPKIIHRDVKAANVLLDEDFEAVVGDFGLAKLVDVRKTNVTTQVRGTMGHIAPEYLSTGKSSERTDVFGYGIMLLELVTGQRAIDFSRLEEEDDVLLLDHVKKLEREKRLDAIVDRNLNKSCNIEEVEMMIQVALLCTQSSPEDRPTMSEVVRMLEGEGLAERWEEWQHVEVNRRQEYERLHRRFDWGEDSIYNQDAIELSGGR